MHLRRCRGGELAAPSQKWRIDAAPCSDASARPFAAQFRAIQSLDSSAASLSLSGPPSDDVQRAARWIVFLIACCGPCLPFLRAFLGKHRKHPGGRGNAGQYPTHARLLCCLLHDPCAHTSLPPATLIAPRQAPPQDPHHHPQEHHRRYWRASTSPSHLRDPCTPSPIGTTRQTTRAATDSHRGRAASSACVTTLIARRSGARRSSFGLCLRSFSSPLCALLHGADSCACCAVLLSVTRRWSAPPPNQLRQIVSNTQTQHAHWTAATIAAPMHPSSVVLDRRPQLPFCLYSSPLIPC